MWIARRQWCLADWSIEPLGLWGSDLRSADAMVASRELGLLCRSGIHLAWAEWSQCLMLRVLRPPSVTGRRA